MMVMTMMIVMMVMMVIMMVDTRETELFFLLFQHHCRKCGMYHYHPHTTYRQKLTITITITGKVICGSCSQIHVTNTATAGSKVTRYIFQ